jgi:hypothetical protein
VELLQMWTCGLIEQPALKRSRGHDGATRRALIVSIGGFA